MKDDARSDAEVVAAVLGGDIDAYGVLVERYRDDYTRFAVRMLGNIEDADDALQSAFVRGFRSLASCRDPERFGAWLYQIAVNECRTLGTRRGNRERRIVRDEIEMERAQAPETAEQDWGEEIQNALNRIDPDQREAFILKYVEDLSYEQMTEITGVGISALKMRVKRACTNLRALLEEVAQ
jgi:RNA polymerase sigma-70 factor (ECF subfamily)